MFLNSISGLSYELVSIVCGFILPRLILRAYGSQVNGLLSSITQFLSVISLLEMGIGMVIRSALYGPLASGDEAQVSRVMVSANRFFRMLAGIFLAYTACLILAYPTLSNNVFGFGYTASLIAAMSATSFFQYFIGLKNGLLLIADQRGYIQSFVMLVTVVLNTALSAIEIRLGAGIQLVKLSTSLVYLARPLFLAWYVRRHYRIDWKITYEREPIAQKWNGVAQHMAFIVLTSTDSIVLTLFSTLTNVSIYSVYMLVINGVNGLFNSIQNGISSLFGDLWAKRETDKLSEFFDLVVWAINSCVVFVFGCTAVLIAPFVRVYTAGIQDANYDTPLFALIITLAYGVYCLRAPYHLMIQAGGHYRQTQSNYIIAALVNIVVSVVFVVRYGLIGVAAGTLAAMLYQTVWMAWYNAKELVKCPFGRFAKQFAADAAAFAISYLLTFRMTMQSVSYLAWVLLAVKVALVWLAVEIALNLVLFRGKVKRAAELMLKR